MKKISIILLAVLLIFTITSCEKDKTEEVISNYEKFVKAYKIGGAIQSIGNETIGKGGEIKAENYGGSSKGDVELIAKALYNYTDTFIIPERDASATDTGITAAKGTVENIQGYTDNNHLTFTDCEFSYTYTLDGATGTGKISFSGTYSCDEKDKVKTYVCDFVVNNETYKAEYTIDDGFFTAAKINGTDVDVRLLNSSNKID